MQQNLNKTCKIGVDLMGNENSPEDLLSSLSSFQWDADIELVLIGDPRLRPFFEKVCRPHFSFQEAPDTVLMTDTPVFAMKTKKKSSMFTGLRLLEERQIDAFVSAGNTGALVLGSKIILSNLPKVKRPALLGLLPTKKKPVAILDLGANVECKASDFVNFALLASSYCHTIHGITKAKVALLNVGEEPIKGTSEKRLAYRKLQEISSFEFVGNMEASSLFEGDIDILVTDGFTGNTLLKTAEGIAGLLLDKIQRSWPPSVITAAAPQIADLKSYLHYAQYQGALLIGVDGLVIKSHGYSTPQAIIKATSDTALLIRKNLLSTLSTVL